MEEKNSAWVDVLSDESWLIFGSDSTDTQPLCRVLKPDQHNFIAFMASTASNIALVLGSGLVLSRKQTGDPVELISERAVFSYVSPEVAKIVVDWARKRGEGCSG